MKMRSEALLFAIESSQGEFEGNAYDSTKFHLAIDLGEKRNGRTIGMVTRPFTFGDSTEIDKWTHLSEPLNNRRPVIVLCDFDVVASSSGTKLTLLGISVKASKAAS